MIAIDSINSINSSRYRRREKAKKEWAVNYEGVFMGWGIEKFSSILDVFLCG